MAGVDVEESYCVCITATKSDELVTKGSVIQSRREGNCIQPGHCYELATESTSAYVPDLDVVVLDRPMSKEFPIRWVCQ